MERSTAERRLRFMDPCAAVLCSENAGGASSSSGSGGGGTSGRSSGSSFFQRLIASLSGVELDLDELLELHASFARVRAEHTLAWGDTVERAEGGDADERLGAAKYSGAPPPPRDVAETASNALLQLLHGGAGVAGPGRGADHASVDERESATWRLAVANCFAEPGDSGGGTPDTNGEGNGAAPPPATCQVLALTKGAEARDSEDDEEALALCGRGTVGKARFERAAELVRRRRAVLQPRPPPRVPRPPSAHHSLMEAKHKAAAKAPRPGSVAAAKVKAAAANAAAADTEGAVADLVPVLPGGTTHVLALLAAAEAARPLLRARFSAAAGAASWPEGMTATVDGAPFALCDPGTKRRYRLEAGVRFGAMLRERRHALAALRRLGSGTVESLDYDL